MNGKRQDITATSPERPFFTRVEALRGLGALAVAGYHFTGWEWIPGRAALMTFFVISGFVLRVSLEYGPQEPGASALRFAIARIFRIYPIVIFSTLVIAVGAEVLPVHATALSFDLGTLLAHMSLLDVRANAVLWALQVEALAAPVILALHFVERRWGWGCLATFAAIATALSFVPEWAVWPPLSRNLFAIALGMLLPSAGRGLSARMSDRAAYATATVAVLALVLSGPLLGFYVQWSGVIEAYAAAALIALCTYRKHLPGASQLDRPGIQHLGRVSGSYYVLHMIVWAWVGAVAASALPIPHWARAPITLLLMLPVAHLSYSCVEAPGIALGRHLIRRLRGSTSRRTAESRT